jgi:hypothetical protein
VVKVTQRNVDAGVIVFRGGQVFLGPGALAIRAAAAAFGDEIL